MPELATITQAGRAPLGAVVGGAVGGTLVVVGLTLLALFKTGRINTVKRGQSSSSAAGSGSSASNPAAGKNLETAQYPSFPSYPEPI